MAKIQDIDLPYLEFGEAAAPGTPASAVSRIYVKADGLFYSKDDAGTETLMSSGPASGAVATDAIWDTAGDLAVGSGANTAAKLVKGAAGANLSQYNGVLAWNGGTSFPASPATGDRYWRSDLGLEAYYDGTQWLTTTLFDMPSTALAAVSATGATRGPSLFRNIYVVSLYATMFHSSGTPSTMYWTLELLKTDPASSDTSLGSISSINNTASTWTPETAAIGAAVVAASFPILRISYIKVSTPGNLTATPGITFRYILT